MNSDSTSISTAGSTGSGITIEEGSTVSATDEVEEASPRASTNGKRKHKEALAENIKKHKKSAETGRILVHNTIAAALPFVPSALVDIFMEGLDPIIVKFESCATSMYPHHECVALNVCNEMCNCQEDMAGQLKLPHDGIHVIHNRDRKTVHPDSKPDGEYCRFAPSANQYEIQPDGSLLLAIHNLELHYFDTEEEAMPPKTEVKSVTETEADTTTETATETGAAATAGAGVATETGTETEAVDEE